MTKIHTLEAGPQEHIAHRPRGGHQPGGHGRAAQESGGAIAVPIGSASPLRILHLISFGGLGGAQQSILGLLQGQDRSRYQPIVACPPMDDLAKAATALGIPVLPLQWPVRLTRVSRLSGPLELFRFAAGVVAALPMVRRAIRESGADLIQTQDLKTHVLGGLAARLERRPCIWHLRDDVGLGLVRAALSFLGAFAAERVVAISSAVGSRLIGPVRRRTVVIYNGVDMRRLEQQASSGETPEALRGEGRRVGMVGHMAPLKGQDLFLRAAAELAPRFPDLQFVVVGDAVYRTTERYRAYKSELQTLAQDLGIANRVVFTGAVDRIGAVLQALDVLVVPSRSEGLGRVAIEGMALGRPVVATCIGGLMEVVVDRETGILVPPEDPAAIARAVAELLENPQRASRMGEEARKQVQKKFPIEGHIERMSVLYDDVAHRQ